MEPNYSVKNIIFDLGGVLLTIDFQKTFDAFRALGIERLEEYFHASYSNPLFAKLEIGAISPQGFYQSFRELTKTELSDAAIRDAWNALLLDFRTESMAYLKQLQETGRYRIFLLSNTNQIHLDAFRMIHFNQFGHHGFDDHFEKAWYSHELGLRKPNASSYEALLQKHHLIAAETLFVDDTLVNIEGAQAVGLQTCWLKAGQQIETSLPKLLG